MIRLFSPFDIYSWKALFLITLIFFLGVVHKFWLLNSLRTLRKIPSSFILPFFHSIKPNYISKITTTILFSLIVIFFLLNFTSIFPFNFSHTRQCRIVLIFSISTWSGLIMFSLVKNVKGLLSHCVPEGSPSYLVVALFGIEIIRNLIRPFTLMIRLVANILAGHLLMSLLGNLVLSVGIGFPVFIVLNIVEIFVSLIQSYIFSTIVILYFRELF